MNEKFLALGSTVAAFVASLCCLGPLILGGVGLGAAMVATFAPLRPYFLALSAVLLASGFYFVYHKPRVVQACEGEVCAPQSRTRRMAKPLLWLATAAVLALAFFPSYGAKLVGTPAVAAPAATAALKTAELKIVGMGKLLETSGVVQVEVHYPAGYATMKYDPARTAPAQLTEAVNATGYKASLAN